MYGGNLWATLDDVYLFYLWNNKEAKAVSIIKIGNKKNDTEVTLKKGKTAQITTIEIKKDKKSNTTEISAMKAVIQK